MKFKAKIENKTITFANVAYARHHLEKFEGKEIIITVEKIHNKRSLNQNAYMWLCLQAISNHTGHSPDELHRLFKGLFLPRNDVVFNGRKFSMAGSTTDLTKGQFVEYMMRISAEAGELGIVLPSIDDYKKGLDTAILLTD